MTEKKPTKKEDSKKEVVASRRCTIANKNFSYKFEAGVKRAINPEHLDELLKTKLVKEA